MPQTLEALPDAPEQTPGRIRWTRAQCDAIREAGVLTGRYELIDGEVISKMGRNPPHATATGLLSDWLSEVFGGPFVRVQQTSDVGDADPEHNEPEGRDARPAGNLRPGGGPASLIGRVRK